MAVETPLITGVVTERDYGKGEAIGARKEITSMIKRNHRPRVRIITFGCRVNQYESEVMRSLLTPRFDIVDDKADLLLLNACTVTSLAERKTRQAMRKLRSKYPLAKIVVIGCLADSVSQGLTQIEGVDLLAGNAWKMRICDVVSRALENQQGLLPAVELSPLAEEHIEEHVGRVRAFLKIQDGCDLACTYCRTTQVRGRSRSKPVVSALSEARELVARGYSEIVIAGINLAQYAPPDGNLESLARGMLTIDGLRRFRLSSINPGGISAELVDVLASDSRACQHFHLPLQSGDDVVLRRMARGYTSAFYLSRVSMIRKVSPDATFGADIMVGFPGETKSAFLQTCLLIREVRFANLHIFRYSPRYGTLAAGFSDPVMEQTKSERAHSIACLGAAIRSIEAERLLGKCKKVLIENKSDGKWRGYTRDYFDTHLLGEPSVAPGDEVDVRIVKVSNNCLVGVKENRTDNR